MEDGWFDASNSGAAFGEDWIGMDLDGGAIYGEDGDEDDKGVRGKK